MSAWAWVLIVVAALAVLAVVTVKALRDHRSRTFRERFGPEYDRTVGANANKRDAETELAARADRRDKLEIRPLPAAARERYLDEWQRVQARFVDDPDGAVHDADMLIQSVMRDRGYPMDDFEQRAADVSVDHPQVVENYRQGHRLAARASALGEGPTENLRQAMQHYRSLFEELVEQTSRRAAHPRRHGDGDRARRRGREVDGVGRGSGPGEAPHDGARPDRAGGTGQSADLGLAGVRGVI